MGIFFGAVHALTPGHSKAVRPPTLRIGGEDRARPAHFVDALLHPCDDRRADRGPVAAVVSIALGSVGRAPLLEDISRGLLALIGAWMLWRALRHGIITGMRAKPWASWRD